MHLADQIERRPLLDFLGMGHTGKVLRREGLNDGQTQPPPQRTRDLHGQTRSFPRVAAWHGNNRLEG